MTSAERKVRKPFPVFNTDEEAERFVDEADHDFSGFKPIQFELEEKARQVHPRISGEKFE